MNGEFTRRDVLAGLSATAGSLLAQGAEPAPNPEKAAADPEVQATPAERDALLKYCVAAAPKLLRAPAGVLKHPSISPSLPKSQYSAELWDWDTLWTARGLFRVSELSKDAALHQAIVAHGRGSLMNFFDHQAPEGRIPMLISVDNSDPLGCLKGTRPHKENQAKPVLAQLALLLADQAGDARWFEPYLAKLALFYRSWTIDNLSRTGLLVWGDDVAIGNDNDPTTFGRPFFSSANLLLNCLYYQDLRAAAELAQRLHRPGEQKQFAANANALAAAIQKHCWDPRDRFFYTADVQCVDRRRELIPGIEYGMDMSWSSIPLRIQTFTGFLPLWCGLATPEQAAALVVQLRDPRTFAAAYGVRSLSASESMYSLAASTNPSNWLGPIWIIVNYLVWRGLLTHGYSREAASLASRTVKMLCHDLRSSGTLNEYYHPDTGAPLSHQGFMDWNLLALEMM